MKLSNTDYILLLNLFLLILILAYLIYLLEYKSGIFIKNDVLSRFCNDQKKYSKKLKGILANKIKVKEYNKKHFPDLKHAITFKILDIKKTDKEYVYKYAEDYDFKEIYSSLPKQYIIKCSVGGFNHHIVKQNNLQELKETCDKLLYIQIPRIVKEAESKNQFQHLQYFPQIYIEEYLDDNLIDYKFEIIHGRISYLLVKNAWEPDMCKFYNEDGESIPNLFNLPGESIELHLPKNFEKMKLYCYKIYEKTKLPLIRMDFYEVNGEIYFGEYTLTPASCRNKISKKSNEYFKKFINNNNI